MKVDYKPRLLLGLITTWGSNNIRTILELGHNFHSETTFLYKRFLFLEEKSLKVKKQTKEYGFRSQQASFKGFECAKSKTQHLKS